MPDTPQTIDLLTRRAPTAPATADDTERTVEATFSTGAAVRRRDFEGEYVERLEVSERAIDLSAIVGAPVLDNHNRWAVEAILGSVQSVRIVGGEARAVLKFSRRDAVTPIWRDIVDGIIRNVSVGYTVETWEDSSNQANGVRQRTATRWTPREISLTGVPADAGATVRTKEDTPMTDTAAAPAPGTEQARPQPPTAADQTRETEIRAIAAVAGLDADFADGLIGRNASVDDARQAALEELARRAGPEVRTHAPPRIIAGASHDDPRVRAEWMGEALYATMTPGHTPSEPARQYVGMGFREIAGEVLRLNNISVTGLSPSSLIERAMATDDYPHALGDTVHRFVRAGYEPAPSGLLMVAAERTAPDFRAKKFVVIGNAGTLDPKPEGAEVRYGSLDEAHEQLQVTTFAKGLVLTREAQINDDRGALQDMAPKLGRAARETEADRAVTVLTSNSGAGPTLSDTKALFHADHGNLAGTGAAISETTLSAARLAMRKQTGLDGKRIDVAPRYVLASPDQETTAQKQLTAIQANAVNDVNPFSVLSLLVEPRLTDANRWYLVGTAVDGLVVVRLEGRPGPQVESMIDFDTKSLKFTVLNDFAVGWIEFRAWYSNPGA